MEVELGGAIDQFHLVNFGGSFGHKLHSHCISDVAHIMRHIVSRPCSHWWKGQRRSELSIGMYFGIGHHYPLKRLGNVFVMMSA